MGVRRVEQGFIVDPDDATTEHFHTARAAFVAALSAASFPKDQASAQAARLQTAMDDVAGIESPTTTITESLDQKWVTLFEGDNLSGLVSDTINFLTNEQYLFQLVQYLMVAARSVSDAARANLKITLEALQSALKEHTR